MTAPVRVHVTANLDGSRQVVVACACVSVGRLYAAWEPLPAAITELRADHKRRAPACPHPWPDAIMTTNGDRFISLAGRPLDAEELGSSSASEPEPGRLSGASPAPGLEVSHETR